MAITVPTYNNPQVQAEPMPSARLNVQTSREAFGGGQSLDNLTNASIGALSEVQQIHNEQRKKADDIIRTDANTRLLQLKNDAIYNPKDGLMTKHGKDSFDALNTFHERYDKGAEEILSGLKTENQREQVSQLAQQHKVDLDGDIQRHVLAETKNYDDQVTKTALDVGRENATNNYHDINKVKAAIAQQGLDFKEYAERNGLDPLVAKHQWEEELSKTHASVFGHMLINEEDEMAKKYFEDHKPEFGDRTADAEKALVEGTSRGESQRQMMAIVGSTHSRAQAIAKARENLKDQPRVQDLTIERIHKYYQEKKDNEEEREGTLQKQAMEYIKQKPGIPASVAIPTPLWTTMSAQSRKAVMSMSSDLKENDDQKWLEFLDKSPDELARMKGTEFKSNYWANFDNSHRAKAEEQWNRAREAQVKGAADPKLSSTLSFNHRVDDALRTNKIIPADQERGKLNSNNARAYAQFEQAAAREIENFELTELGGKRHATGEEQQKIIDKLMLKKVFTKGWFSDSEKPAAVVLDDDKGQTYVPIDKIPLADRDALASKFKTLGKTPSESLLERAYAAYLMNDKTLLKQILSEK